jgi:hypothetical protein
VREREERDREREREREKRERGREKERESIASKRIPVLSFVSRAGAIPDTTTCLGFSVP